MNVGEHDMANNLGLQIIAFLFRVSRRAKRENILLAVVKWEVQLSNFKHDILNSKRNFSYSFRRIRTRDSQSIQERGLFYNFRHISRCGLAKEFVFLENES